MKKIYATLAGLMMAATAGAQSDSIYVRMSFNDNPWQLPVSAMRGWANYDDENGVLKDTHTFVVDVNGEQLKAILTPSDLDETDYYNAMVRGEDFNDGNIVKTVLMTRTGSTLTFQAPESMWMAKVAFETYRRWSSGGLYSGDATGNQHVWGKDSLKTRSYMNGSVEVEYECWHGDSINWGLPACTGQTYLHYIDFWLLPRSGATAITEIVNGKPVNSECYDMQGRRLKATPRRGVYIAGGKKMVH